MERVIFNRDCEATQIPSGTPATLERDTVAFITQSLGGTFTLQVPAYGGLYRISGKDAEAIGKEPLPDVDPQEVSGDLEEQVWNVLRTCYDPEIPLNIVDLGLIYSMKIVPEDGGNRVDVQMTLTAPGCGMGTSLAADARQKLLGLPTVTNAVVDLTWDPPWNPQMISPEGRERLGM